MARKYALSVREYAAWKKQVRDKYLKKFPSKEKYINDFMKHVSNAYDSCQRAFFPSPVMWYLFEKYRRVTRHNQHFWIGFIGKKGGEGKSTLAKQILHFLDPSMRCDRITFTYDEFINSIYYTKSVKKLKYPSILLDEPENKTHNMSGKGRKFRDILEKVRQMNLFVGACANSLNSIPPFIRDRLTAICFLDQKHKFSLWDTDKDPKGTIIDEIQENWPNKKHGIFSDMKIQNRAMFLRTRFSSKCPFDDTDYLLKKEQDLLQDIGDYITDNTPKDKKEKAKKYKLDPENPAEAVMIDKMQ